MKKKKNDWLSGRVGFAPGWGMFECEFGPFQKIRKKIWGMSKEEMWDAESSEDWVRPNVQAHGTYLCGASFYTVEVLCISFCSNV